MVFNKNSNASKLKEQFRKSFERKNETEKLFTFTREEFLQHFQVSEEGNDIEVIEKILKSKAMTEFSGKTAIFLDETSLSGSNSKNNWPKLENSNPNIHLIISFQPIVEATRTRNNREPIQPQLPSSKHINLTRCYRTSTSILQSLKSFHDLNIRRLETESEAVNLVSGCKPTLLSYYQVDHNLKIWIHCELAKYHSKSEQLAILYTDETKDDAKKVFKDSKYKKCVLHWEEFVGCEKSIVVCFFNDSTPK